jgi:hypothetical protein
MVDCTVRTALSREVRRVGAAEVGAASSQIAPKGVVGFAEHRAGVGTRL